MIEYPYKFKYTAAIRRFFKASPIFLAHYNKIQDVFEVGQKLIVHAPTIVEPYATMPKGNFMSMGAFSYSMSNLGPSCSVGRYCSIAKGCQIMGTSHPIDFISTHLFTFRKYWSDGMRDRMRTEVPTPVSYNPDGSVVIGNDVWIGQDVLIKPGVRIGDGAVIGAGSIVTKDVAPYEVKAGVPAVQKRFRFSPRLIEMAQNVRWWDYKLDSFAGLPVNDPEQFLLGLKDRIDDGLQPYRPQPINLAEKIHEIASASDRNAAPTNDL